MLQLIIIVNGSVYIRLTCSGEADNPQDQAPKGCLWEPQSGSARCRLEGGHSCCSLAVVVWRNSTMHGELFR